MDAPQNIEMATRGETPFDLKADASKEAVKSALKMKAAPDMLEMEPHYVNDFIKCNPFEENGCMVNPKYDAYALCNGRYMSEGCHLAAPAQEGMHEAKQTDATGVPVASLKPIYACCCDMSSLYLDFPACIGASMKCTTLFFMCRGSYCKCIDSMAVDEDKRCFALCECQKYLIIPKTCCMCQGQYCCCDYRAALPCTNEVPSMVNVLGFNLMADMKCKTGCCKTVGELVPRLAENADE